MWAVQERDEDGPWRDAYVGTSSYRAFTTYHDLQEPKRLLRDGRVLPVRTITEQLDFTFGTTPGGQP